MRLPPFFGLRLLIALAFAATAACDGPSDASASGIARAARDHGFALKEPPAAVPDFTFQDGDGRALSLSDFRGRVVVLNVWATWCAPCREEMPMLDNVQAELGGPDLEVIALSIDHSGPEVVRTFFEEVGIEHLRLYIEHPTGQALSGLNVHGIPATLLLDREGREIGRRLGVAEWDSPEMLRFFRQVAEQR